MDSKELVVLEEKIKRMINENDSWRKKQEERFDQELKKRDKRIDQLYKTLDQVQEDNKAAKGKLDRIIAKLEAFT